MIGLQVNVRNWACINCNAKHSEKTYEEADKNNRKWYHVGEYNEKNT